MLHPLPGASRKRVPPSADVPSGNTLGSITREVTSTLRPCSSRASPHFSSPIGSKPPAHAPGQAGGGSRLPTVPLRFTAARLAAPAHPE